MLVWKLWTVYTGMFAVTAILSCVIKIRGLFKSTKCGRLKMSNLKLSQPGVIKLSSQRTYNFQIFSNETVTIADYKYAKIFKFDMLDIKL